MHFGQFNLMGYRERGTPARQLFDEAVAQSVLAEQAGFEIAWIATLVSLARNDDFGAVPVID